MTEYRICEVVRYDSKARPAYTYYKVQEFVPGKLTSTKRWKDIKKYVAGGGHGPGVNIILQFAKIAEAKAFVNRLKVGNPRDEERVKVL